MSRRPGDGGKDAARVRELEERRVAIEAGARLAEQSYASLIEALAAAAGRMAEISRDDPAAARHPVGTEASRPAGTATARVAPGPVGERPASSARKPPAD